MTLLSPHQLWENFGKKAQLPWPSLECRWTEEGREEYAAHKEAGRITVEAKSLSAARYAATQLGMGLLSGHIQEWLGFRSARWPLRMLWIYGEQKVAVTSHWEAYLPQWLISVKDHLDSCREMEIFCRRVIELGYNTVLFGERIPGGHGEACIEGFPWEQFFSLLHSYGLKVVFFPKTTPSCPPIEELNSFSFDYFFWQADPLSLAPTLHSTMTHYEALREELRFLEKNLDKDLIYYLPHLSDKNQKGWWKGLLEDVSKRTLLAFSAVAGVPYEDYLPDHPLWEWLREWPNNSLPSLLPLINGGCVRMGEGLWPILSCDVSEKLLAHLTRHSFAGVGCLTSSHLPKEKGLLDCSLWVLGQSLWNNISPSLLVQSWSMARFGSSFSLEPFQLARSLATRLNEFFAFAKSARAMPPSEKLRRELEDIAQRLHYFSVSEMGPFEDYKRFFVLDAKRMLSQVASELHLPLNIRGPEEQGQESFWTDPQSGFRSSPYSGKQGSLLRQIYGENRLFI